jgi:putative endonuclease
MSSVELNNAETWVVYILRCRDDSLYTGITTDLPRRLLEHNSSKRGASYTRGRRPVDVVFSQSAPDRSTASKLEARIKSLNRAAKESLIEEGFAGPQSQP